MQFSVKLHTFKFDLKSAGYIIIIIMPRQLSMTTNFPHFFLLSLKHYYSEIFKTPEQEQAKGNSGQCILTPTEHENTVSETNILITKITIILLCKFCFKLY